jgi:hypothetical protein
MHKKKILKFRFTKPKTLTETDFIYETKRYLKIFSNFVRCFHFNLTDFC